MWARSTPCRTTSAVTESTRNGMSSVTRRIDGAGAVGEPVHVDGGGPGRPHLGQPQVAEREGGELARDRVRRTSAAGSLQ